MDLEGKRLLVAGTGETTAAVRSVASLAYDLGARVTLASSERAGSLATDGSRRAPPPWDVLDLDVTAPDARDALQGRLSGDWVELDGAFLAIPSGPPRAPSTEATPGTGSVTSAFQRTAYSLSALARAVLPLMPQSSERGASIVGLATAPGPRDGLVDACAAALESVNRYLACSLGPRGVRVNLVRAATTPREEPDDADPAARAACFLLSDWSRAVTGEVLRVGAREAPGTGRAASSAT